MTISTIKHHTVAGSLRGGPLPTAEIDGLGTVYVAWSDCRFRRSCKVNDIVLTHSLDATGTTWSSISRVPIDTTNSNNVDHFIPGLGVNKSTSTGTAQLGLTSDYYPAGTTSLSVGFVSSSNAGASWSSAQVIQTGMSPAWAANTSQGRTVGDYISTSYGSDNQAHGVFGSALTPTTGGTTSCTTSALDNCNAPMSASSGLAAASTVAAHNDPILFTGNGGTNAASLWNLVANNGSKHRD